MPDHSTIDPSNSGADDPADRHELVPAGARLRCVGELPLAAGLPLTMDAAVLLVTWMVFGQPPSSYQTGFESMELCEMARQAVLRDADRVRAERKAADDQARHQPGVAFYNAAPLPSVSAVCVARTS